MGLFTGLFLLFIFTLVIQFFFYGFIFRRLAFYNANPVPQKSIAVSVIICAKDEEENLRQFLPLILKQNYPNFEVVLINDRSWDNTLEVMNKFRELHSNVRVVDVKENERFYGNKKYALTLGIKAAINDFLLLTDADCRPNSDNWISEMSRHFSKQHSIVLGYGAYKKMGNSYLNNIIRYETLLAASQYLSLALLKHPYMGVGRNLAYRKGLFIENNGFNEHIKLKSGDDDLLISKIANRNNTVICIDKSAFTVSEPKKNLKEWIYQKRRHISTSKFYSNKHKFILGSFYQSQLLFYVLAIFLIAVNYKLSIVLAMVCCRMALQLFIMTRISQKLDEQDIAKFLPLLEIALIVFQMYIFIYNLISKPKHWN